MWTHYCEYESEIVHTGTGEPCSWCGACESDPETKLEKLVEPSSE